MVELDLLKEVAPSVRVRPIDRTRARVRLDAAITGRPAPVTQSSARRRRVLRIGLVTGLAVLLGVGAIVAPRTGGPGGSMLSSAQALVLPDGSVLGQRKITKYILAGRTDQLRERLGLYGIRIEVTQVAVHPGVAGELLGWEFYPANPAAAASEPFDSTWEVNESDVGSLLKVRMGRAPEEGEAYSTAGLGSFQIYPELCDAVVFDDPGQTHRNLLAAGFEIQWILLPSDPHKPGYDPPNGTHDEPPSSGEIYAIWANVGKIRPGTDTHRSVTLEVLEPEDAGPTVRTAPAYCEDTK